MISATKFREKFFNALPLLVATKLPLEISWHGRVYQVFVREVEGVKPLRSMPLRPLKRVPKINPYKDMIYGDCRLCGYLTVNDTCLDPQCETLKTDPKRLFNPEKWYNEQNLKKYKKATPFEGSPLTQADKLGEQ